LDERERTAAVRALAREGDPDRYLSALFASPDARDALFALYAFNAELARIAELVTEPGLGEIRLQWWRDALEHAAAGMSTGHPVADALGQIMLERGVSREDLSRLIDARQFDVTVKLMPDREARDTYLAETAGVLFQLGAEIAGAGRKAEHVAKAAGKASKAAGLAYGLTGLMRALPVHAARGRIDIPADMLLRQGTSQAELARGKTTEGLKQVLAELRRDARASLHAALGHLETLPASERTAFRPLALVEPYLRALEKGDPLHSVADINPLYRLWRLGTYRIRAGR
jgi:15-cis-phytoene synthase